MFDIHDLLGVIGFVGNFPGPYGVAVSVLCEVANAVIYFKEGDPLMGALSLVCAIPGIGDVIGAVQYGTKLAKVAKTIGNAIRMAQKAYVTVASAETALELAGDAKMEYAVNGGEMTVSIIAKEFGAIALAGLAAVSSKSLVKDVSSLAKIADVHFKTTRLERSDAASGKKIQYGGVGGCFVAGTLVNGYIIINDFDNFVVLDLPNAYADELIDMLDSVQENARVCLEYKWFDWRLDMDELNEYSYIWEEDKDKYVLFYIEDRISIYFLNQGMTMYFLMEDDNLADLIVEKMLESGNRICHSWEELRELAISSAETLHEMLRDSDD